MKISEMPSVTAEQVNRIRYEAMKIESATELKQKEIEQLNAKLAMCVEALKESLEKMEDDESYFELERGNGRSLEKREEDGDLSEEIIKVRKILSATKQDVQKWRREIEAKAIDECAEELDYMAGVELALKDIAQQKRSDR